MICKVTGDLHLWGWTEFKERINGKLVDYDCDGLIIYSVTYEVDGPIDDKIIQEYGVTVEEIVQ